MATDVNALGNFDAIIHNAGVVYLLKGFVSFKKIKPWHECHGFAIVTVALRYIMFRRGARPDRFASGLTGLISSRTSWELARCLSFFLCKLTLNYNQK